jgi:hypothetical protein
MPEKKNMERIEVCGTRQLLTRRTPEIKEKFEWHNDEGAVYPLLKPNLSNACLCSGQVKTVCQPCFLPMRMCR